MARSYGKILASLVTDDEFNELAADEQTLFFRLLGHPNVSLVGKLDYRPHHWCQYARGWTREVVEELTLELVGRRYLAIDIDTEEVLIRSLTRHDGIPFANAKLRKGLWGAWSSVASRELRRVAVENMPPEVFAFDDVPDAALKIHRSPSPDRASFRLPDYLIEGANERVPDSLPATHLPLVTSAAAESACESARRGSQAVDGSWDGFAARRGSTEGSSTPNGS